MTTELAMPQLGETVTEGTIVSWLVDVADHVVEGQPIVEVSTDKVDTDVPAPVAGEVAEILVGEGDSVDVGRIIAVIVEAGDGVARPPVSRALASPVAREIAGRQDLDLAEVEGTGPNGAVIKRDVIALLNAGAEDTPAHDRASPAPEREPDPPPIPAESRPSADTAATPIIARVQLSTAGVERVGSPHPLVAFVVRAVVDAIRAAAPEVPGLADMREPRVGWQDPTRGLRAAITDAPSLRLHVISARLAEAGTGPALPSDVSVIDCTGARCSLGGALEAPLELTIGPPTTVPQLQQRATGSSISFETVTDLSIAADATRFSLGDLDVIATRIASIVEGRDWSSEL